MNRQIGCHRQSFAAVAGDFTGDGVNLRFRSAAQHHICAGLSQAQGNHAANAAARSGHNRRLSGKIENRFHAFLLLTFMSYGKPPRTT